MTLNVKDADQGFEKLYQEKGETSRRKPIRVLRLWQTFKRNNFGVTAIEEFTEFQETRNPERDLAGAISWVNKEFARLRINLRIKHVTAYMVVYHDNSK